MNAYDTESRLRDALGAAARTMPDSATGPGLESAGRPAPARRWPLVALAAAAAIVLAAIVPQAILRQESGRPGQADQPSARAVAAPPYFIGFGEDAGEGRPEGSGEARVYSSTTGEPIGTAPIRLTDAAAEFTSVAAAADQRTFYLAATDGACDSTILRVVLRDDGTVRDQRSVSGGRFDQRLIRGLAVSPDGRKLAFGSIPTARSDGLCTAHLDPRPVTVLDVSTGKKQTWTSLSTGAAIELAWAPDNRRIAFLWKETGALSTLRLLDTAVHGDLLAGRAVPSDPANLRNLTITADGSSAQVVRRPGESDSALLRIDLSTGKVEVVDGQLNQKGVTALVADASRQHLLAWGTAGGDTEPPVDRKLGRYENGRVDWFEGTSTIMTFAW